MNKKGKEQRENIRLLGKSRYIFFRATFYTCIQALFFTLIRLYPNGNYISLNDFLFWVIVHIVAGYFLGLFMWSMGERKFNKSDHTTN